MPSAPNCRATLASCGVSALVRTPSLRNLSTSFMKPWNRGFSVASIISKRAGVDLALGAVERDQVAFLELHVADRQPLGAQVDLHVAGADDAALAPAAGHQGRVAGHAAAGGQNALGRAHAFHVLGVGLFADEDHLLALLGRFDGVDRGEDDLAARAARAGRQTRRGTPRPSSRRPD